MKKKEYTVSYLIMVRDQYRDMDTAIMAESKVHAIELAQKKIPRGKKFKIVE